MADVQKPSPFRIAKAYFAPGKDPAQNIIGFMANTKKTLDIAIFSFTLDEIGQAVIDAHKRGVKVRVVMDKGQAIGLGSEYKKLHDAGVPVRLDKRPGLMHDKMAISDYGTRKPALITGSFNWSMRASSLNRENLVIIRYKKVIQQFHDMYEQMWLAIEPVVVANANANSVG